MAMRMGIKIVFMSTGSLKSFIKIGHIHLFTIVCARNIEDLYRGQIKRYTTGGKQRLFN